ncbi:MAG: lipid-A-disaccharide synthase [Negativicutes bacterium]|nr:lipid-A-disaccharide synthase [Negativicutes bacterium]
MNPARPVSAPPTILISAGEASGDMHGAALAAELRRRAPELRLIGMGGERMRRAGVEIYYPVERLGFMGLVEVVKRLPQLWRLRRLVRSVISRERPAVVVLVDYPGFNMMLAAWARQLGLKTVFYISPSVWAWNRRRAWKIARTADLVTALFPFEAEVYREAGAKVEFIGHPLLDIVSCATDRSAAKIRLGWSEDDQVVMLLPGSRQQEVERLLPAMLQTARRLAERQPALRFLLPRAGTVGREWLSGRLAGAAAAGLDLRVIDDAGYEVYAAADVALAASGTVTLELALLGVPTVMVYKVAWLSYLIGRMIIRLKLFSLPNIVAGKEVIPEFIQHRFRPAEVADKLWQLLTDRRLRSAMLDDFRLVAQRLGEGGAVARAAGLVLSLAGWAGRRGPSL